MWVCMKFIWHMNLYALWMHCLPHNLYDMILIQSTSCKTSRPGRRAVRDYFHIWRPKALEWGNKPQNNCESIWKPRSLSLRPPRLPADIMSKLFGNLCDTLDFNLLSNQNHAPFCSIRLVDSSYFEKFRKIVLILSTDSSTVSCSLDEPVLLFMY